jgi:hypothetical protein
MARVRWRTSEALRWRIEGLGAQGRPLGGGPAGHRDLNGQGSGRG